MDHYFPSSPSNEDYVFNAQNVNPNYFSGSSFSDTPYFDNSYYHDYVNYYSGFYQPQVDYTQSSSLPPSPPAPAYPYQFNATPPTQFWDSPTSLVHPMQPTTSQGSTPSSRKFEKKCSHCSATETCQWRNARSKDTILCNACFTYQRKYKKCRPLTVVQKFRNREEKKRTTTK